MTYCPNISCPSRIPNRSSISRAAARWTSAGLGYERVRALLDAKLLATVADLYK